IGRALNGHMHANPEEMSSPENYTCLRTERATRDSEFMKAFAVVQRSSSTLAQCFLTARIIRNSRPFGSRFWKTRSGTRQKTRNRNLIRQRNYDYGAR